MLGEHHFHTTMPCADLERAKSFYIDKVGLKVAEETPGGIFFEADGTRVFLFKSTGAASGAATQLGISVTDIDAEVKGLKDRGVKFEEYDFPDFNKETSIAATGPVRSAWFKDTEGNLIGVVQLT